MRTAIVVPTYNRPEALAACLAALDRLDPAPDEIVVVDDGGVRPAAAVCTRFNGRVRCIRQASAGPAAARNAGVRASTADLVALTDDDCAPRPDWLGALVRAQGGVRGRMAGGRVENALTTNVYAAASQALCDYLYMAGGAVAGGAEFFTTNNVAFDRATFEAIGGFDESFLRAAGEDRDLGRRWRAAGGTLVYEVDAVVDHAHGMDLRGFWRQQANYGRGARQLHARTRARADGDGPRLSRAGFYAGIVSHPLRDGRPRPLARSALLALAQVATAWGYARERPR